MKDQSKTKQVLIQELASLRQRIEELEQSESVRKRVEETLRESEGRYRRIAENMSDIVSEVDPQGIIRYASPSYKRLFGEIQYEVTGRNAFDSIHPEDKDRVAAEYMEGIRTRTDREVEYRVRHADGHYIWLRSFGHSFFGAAGELLGMIVTSRDITERKQAEDDLRESEERFKALFEKSLDAQILMDHEGKVIDCNDAFVELFCLRGKSEVIGHRPSDFAPEHQLDGTPSSEIGKKIRTSVLEKGSARFEWLHQKHDPARTPIFAELSLTLIRIANRPMIHVIIHDITERKQAEESLKQSEERMRLFFERQLVGMAITSPEKGWLQVNKKLIEMLGYTPEELSLRTWAEMTHPDDLAADVAQFNRLLSGGIDHYFLEKRFIRKDGDVISTNLSVGCVRRQDGSVDYVLALLEGHHGAKTD